MNNYITGIIATLILFCGCQQRRDEKILEVRKYLVQEGVKSDSIWSDTLYKESSNEKGLSKLMYQIDSNFSMGLESSFGIGKATVTPEGSANWNDLEVTKYVVEYPTEHGDFSYYGIYVNDIGTVYWRWLDGKASLRLLERYVSKEDKIYNYKELLNYLETTFLAVPPLPQDTSTSEEIEGELELDTALLH